MNKIAKLLRGTTRLPDSGAAVRRVGQRIEVRFRNGRKQMVRIWHRGDRYELSSTVIGKRRADEHEWEDLAERLWGRNRETDVVGFGLDGEGGIGGKIEQLAQTLDREELVYYLDRLAFECNRLEYIMTGRNIRYNCWVYRALQKSKST